METTRTNKHKLGSTGFTIIELLIATIIFSLVLILLVAGIIQITKYYYEGIVKTNTQNTARNILNDVSQAIQFSGNTVVPLTPAGGGPASQGWCIGNQRYSFITGYELENTANPSYPALQVAHALVVDPQTSCLSGGSAQDLQSPTPAGQELLGTNMRLATFTIAPIAGTDLVQIDVRVVYGASDLLCAPLEQPTSCSQNGPMGNGDFTDPDLQCKGALGLQFCNVSELKTTVEIRL